MSEHGSTRFMEGGKGLLVGLLTPEGEPFATRAWGVHASGPDGYLRVLVDAADMDRLGLDIGLGSIAVTAADIPTLRSMQVKGRVVGTAAATADDRRRARAYCDAFFGVLVETDGMDRALLERLVPREFAVCTVSVEEVFDQTPGPGAGAPVAGPDAGPDAGPGGGPGA